MPIKTILVPLNALASDRTTLDLALGVAREPQAHIEALFVKRNPAEALTYAGMGSDPASIQMIANQILREADDAGARVKRELLAWCMHNDVVESDRPGISGQVTVSFRERVGSARSAIAEIGRMVDLIVMTGLHDTDVRLPEVALEAALFETGRPVLLAPAALPPPGTDTAVVAWNGSLESTRAVAAAMPLLVRCKQLFVFCRSERHRPAADPAELLGYFAWHGLKAERLRVFQEHGGLGEDLLAATRQVGAGLLVMGAYTHHRLRQMIVGGVTSHVLHHAKMPVLFAH